MSEAIKILNEEKTDFVVDTRAMWEAISSKREYSHWIKYYIDKFNWVEGKHYIVKDFDMTKNVKSNTEPNSIIRGGDRKSKTYFITKQAEITLMKEVHPDKDIKANLINKTDELATKLLDASKDPVKMILIACEYLVKQQEEIKQLTTNIKKLEGNDLDVLFYAKDVGAELGISATKLNRFLKEQRVIYNQNGHWHVYLERAKEGLFREVKENIKGSTLYVSVLKITPKGRLFIKDLWNKVNGL